jgi:putative endonuclease
MGNAGEDLACRYLSRKGYVLVQKNWRCQRGEIDLVMLDGDCLVFVEVKTRRGAAAGAAEEAISVAKARRLLASGDWYVMEHPEHGDRFWRIDLVAITLERHRVERVTHIANAVVV